MEIDEYSVGKNPGPRTELEVRFAARSRCAGGGIWSGRSAASGTNPTQPNLPSAARPARAGHQPLPMVRYAVGYVCCLRLRLPSHCGADRKASHTEQREDADHDHGGGDVATRERGWSAARSS